MAFLGLLHVVLLLVKVLPGLCQILPSYLANPVDIKAMEFIGTAFIHSFHVVLGQMPRW